MSRNFSLVTGDSTLAEVTIVASADVVTVVVRY